MQLLALVVTASARVRYHECMPRRVDHQMLLDFPRSQTNSIRNARKPINAPRTGRFKSVPSPAPITGRKVTDANKSNAVIGGGLIDRMWAISPHPMAISVMDANSRRIENRGLDSFMEIGLSGEGRGRRTGGRE